MRSISFLRPHLTSALSVVLQLGPKEDVSGDDESAEDEEENHEPSEGDTRLAISDHPMAWSYGK